MGEPMKKISFAFSKSTKKTAPVRKPPEENNVQYIDCVEENSIKVVAGDSKDELEPLVIPMKNDNLLRDNMIAAVESRITIQTNTNSENLCPALSNDGDDLKTLTLDQLAAKELLEESVKMHSLTKEGPKVHSVPLSEKIGKGETESTLEDYENIPVSDFGLAMLRGMGWKPDEGIGKSKKLVKAPSPILRPKGMGLGADKVIQHKQEKQEETDLQLKKGSCVKLIAGQNKHLYGKVEGMDEDSGRVIVKLAIEGTIISVNEFMVVTVSKQEYSKNSNVINVAKYNEYKSKEVHTKVKPDSSEDQHSRKLEKDTRSEISSKKSDYCKSEFVNKTFERKDRNSRSRSLSVDRKYRNCSKSSSSKKVRKKYSSDSDVSSRSDSPKRHHSKRHKYHKKSHSKDKGKHKKHRHRSRSRS